MLECQDGVLRMQDSGYRSSSPVAGPGILDDPIIGSGFVCAIANEGHCMV